MKAKLQLSDLQSKERVLSSIKISVFKNVLIKNGAPPEAVLSLSEFHEHMQSDEIKQLTLRIRPLKNKNPKTYKDTRTKEMPVYCIGEWKNRGSLLEHSLYTKFLAFDFDGGEESTHIFNLKSAENSPYIYRVEQSLGGGTRVFVLATFPKGAREKAYLEIATHLSKVFKIPLGKDFNKPGEYIDTGTHDITRMWFLSYTPSNLIYENEKWEVYNYTPTKQLAIDSREGKKDNERRGGKYYREFTEEEKALDIIRQIVESGTDITAGRNDVWFPKILLPIANLFGESGRQYAHNISQFHPDYSEDETNKEYDEAIKKDTGRVSIGSFLEYARQKGFRYDTSRLLASHKKNDIQTEERGMKIIPASPFEEPKLPSPTVSEHGFYTQDNRYFFKNKKSYESVSNFLLSPMYLLMDSKEPKRILKIDNCYNQSAIICVPVKTLSRSSEFAAIVEGKGNFVPSWNNTQFSSIKEYLYQYEKRAEEISVLGHQPGNNHYAFSNGIFDGKHFYYANEYGIVTIKDQHCYLPAFSIVNEDAEKEYHNERKFIFQQGRTNFSEWSQLLIQVFGDNAIAGICFLVASVFRDIVFKHVNSFPLLFLFGPKGTGKTTFRNALHRLFGNYGPNDAIGLGSSSSPKGFARKLAQIKNGLQPFEEYKNGIGNLLIEMLKNIYDGIGYERAQTTNDNRTHSTLVNSSVILGGQEMPSKENALFSRVIMLTFSKTKFSDSEKKAFRDLEEAITDGLGNVLLEVLEHREEMEKKFAQAFSKVYGHLRKYEGTNVMEERTLSNVAALLAPFLVLSELLEFPFDYKSAFKFITDRISEQHRQMSKTNEVNQFWDTLDVLHGNKFIKGVDYNTSDGILSINMKKAHSEYMEHASKQNLNTLDYITLRSYLSMQPYFINQKGDRKDKMVRIKDSPVANPVRCMQFQVEGMNDLELNFLS